MKEYQTVPLACLPHFAVKLRLQSAVCYYPPNGGGRMYNHIRELREDRDLKQRQVAEYLQCSQQVYSNYELGQRDIPTDILIKLSQFYNVSVDYLLGITDHP